MTLADLHNGKPGLIVGFSKDGEQLHRLHRMGVIPGANAEVLRTAPLGDPMQVRVESTLLSIRKKDAEQINVEHV